MKRIRNFFLLVGVFISVSVTAQDIDYAKPKEYIIGGITVTGTKNLDDDILITISKLRIGDKIRIPGEEITGAIKNLWGQKLFNDIDIYQTKVVGDTVYLEIALEERDRLSNLIFRGVKKTEATDLKEKLEGYSNGLVNENLLNRVKNITRKHYVDKGYLFTEVSTFPRKDTLRTGYSSVVVTVDKKTKIKVNEISFTGNEAFSDRKLEKAMKNTKERRWYKIFGSKKFVESKYEEDKKTMLAKFSEKGYRDVRIVSDSIYRYNDRSVNIDIAIEEGKKYYFGNIVWSGNAIYSDRQLKQILRIEKGDVYDEERLNKRLTGGILNSDDVASLYQNNGYLFSRVMPITTGIRGDSIDVEIRVYEGEQATINEVTVKGNDRTNDKVIYRELYTRPGDQYNRANIMRTLNELRSMGYFNEQTLDVQPIPHQENGTVDIVYTVEERPSDQIQLSGGFGGGRIIGTVGLTFNNFSVRKLFSDNWGGLLPSGDGQKLSLRVQTNGKYYQNYSFSFSEPWLGGKKPNRLTVGVFFSKQSSYTSFANIRDPDRQLSIGGFNIGIEKDLKVPDDYFKLSSVLNLQRYKLKDWFSGSFVFNNGTAYTISLTEQLSRYSLNNRIFPTAGSSVSLSIQATPPYSLFNNIDYTDPNLSPQKRYRMTEFHKWKFNSQWFMTVYGKLVLKAQADFGFVGTYNKNVGVTPFERFLLGGSGMQQFFNLNAAEVIGLRGYNDGVIIPADGNQNVGSPIYNKYALELRYPISLSGNSAQIFAMAFVEGGNTWTTFDEFNPFNVKRSAGVGVRIFLPIFGLLGLDYGFAFDDIPGNPDAHQPFQFTINKAF